MTEDINWSLSAALSDQREIGILTQTIETFKRCVEDGLSTEEAMKIALRSKKTVDGERRKVEMKSKTITFEPLYELGAYVDIKLPGDDQPHRHQLQEYIVKYDGVWYKFNGLTMPEADVREYARAVDGESAEYPAEAAEKPAEG